MNQTLTSCTHGTRSHRVQNGFVDDSASAMQEMLDTAKSPAPKKTLNDAVGKVGDDTP